MIDFPLTNLCLSRKLLLYQQYSLIIVELRLVNVRLIKK